MYQNESNVTVTINVGILTSTLFHACPDTGELNRVHKPTLQTEINWPNIKIRAYIHVNSMMQSFIHVLQRWFRQTPLK